MMETWRFPINYNLRELQLLMIRKMQYQFVLLSMIPISLLMPLSACGIGSGGVSGQVVEQGTNMPLADAIVVATWRGTTNAFADSQTSCWHVDSARTDSHGHYQIAAWTLSSPMVNGVFSDLDKHPGLDVYMRGYVRVEGGESPARANMKMEHFKGSADERLELLWGLVSFASCSNIGADSFKNRYRLYASIYAEAEALATTPKQRETLFFIKQFTSDSLVNYEKPTAHVGEVLTNTDPNDSYKAEDLLK